MLSLTAMPGGAVSEDKTIRIPTEYNFFLPVIALSKIFRAKFRDALKETDLFDQVQPSGRRSRFVGRKRTGLFIANRQVMAVRYSNTLHLMSIESP
jgi:hypothetical protein